MEITILIPYLISILSLTVVLVQFFVRRNDEKRSFILNKRYELYQNFMEDFNRLDRELMSFHDRISKIKPLDKFLSDSETTLEDMKKMIFDYFKPVLDFSFSPFVFNLISNQKLNVLLYRLYDLFDERKKETLKRIYDAKTSQDCVSEFRLLRQKYETNQAYGMKINDLYQDALRLMRRDLGISTK